MQNIYALSIAGPFGYWIASAKKTADGIKSIEVRSWKRNLAPGTVVLIHTSSNRSYDDYFQPLGIDLSDAPKFSILGAVTFQGCRVYNEDWWEKDQKHHCWQGDASWKTVFEGYGSQPVGHVFSDPILFANPILDVPGEFGYWQPNPKKPQFERQQKGFDKALALLKQLQYKPVAKPIEQPLVPIIKTLPTPKPDPNCLTVFFGPNSICLSYRKTVWDIQRPSTRLVKELRQKAEYVYPNDDSVGRLYMTPEAVEAIGK
jgi:hypothetical protein